jgi:hypothetical protein
MTETTLKLTADERAFLLELLERTLKDTRVEEHRTRAPSYREFVLKQEGAMASIMGKLGQPPK